MSWFFTCNDPSTDIRMGQPVVSNCNPFAVAKVGSEWPKGEALRIEITGMMENPPADFPFELQNIYLLIFEIFVLQVVFFLDAHVLVVAMLVIRADWVIFHDHPMGWNNQI